MLIASLCVIAKQRRKKEQSRNKLRIVELYLYIKILYNGLNKWIIALNIYLKKSPKSWLK